MFVNDNKHTMIFEALVLKANIFVKEILNFIIYLELMFFCKNLSCLKQVS